MMVATRVAKARASLDFKVYQQQHDFITADEHFVAIIAGIGAGKTLAGSIKSGMASQGQIGTKRVPVPNIGMVTAPTYPMLRDVSLRTFLEMWKPLIADYNKNESRVTMKNGSEILFRSASNPDTLRGPNLLWWWPDEAAFYHPDVWRIMIGRLRAHGMQGYAWPTTTPAGTNWLYQVFGQEQRPDYRVIKASTWMNPFISADYYRMLAREYSGEFAEQELHGEFIKFSGLIYDQFKQSKHVLSAPLRTAVYHVAGVDWGYANPGVILIGQVDTDGGITIVAEEYERQRRIEAWVEVGKALHQAYNIETLFCDPSEPDYIRQFVDAGLKAVPADNSVRPGIQKVQNRLVNTDGTTPRLLITRDCPNLIKEMEQYQWAKNQIGMMDVPRKANDHCADSCRYMVMGIDGNKYQEMYAGGEVERYA